VRLVIVESPFAGRPTGWIAKVPGLRWLAATVLRWRNVRYARAAVRHSVLRGESPIASHLLLTQPGILRDEVPEERALGIEAGLAWGLLRLRNPEHGPLTAIYTNCGLSSGVGAAEWRAKQQMRPHERRVVPGWRIPWWARWCS
jgi:hypothetical protein